MANEAEKDYRQWLQKANDDELSVKAILRDECGGSSAGCFLSQQMAEKFLKGLLVFYHQPFPKVHDLLNLETLLLALTPEISQIHNELELLNRHYIETRYQAEYPTFNFDDCREALKAALRVKEFVLRKVK